MKSNFFKALGPGLIWAGASIGVSHLVQSTRAGADYGFQLLWVVLLINLLKYPFFEFGPRYAASTGRSLLHGYRKMGKWAIILYLCVTIGTMFTLQAAVTAVTAGLFGAVFPSTFSFLTWSILLIVVCIMIIVVGQYKFLDRIMKGVVVILALTTLAAVFFSFQKGVSPDLSAIHKMQWNKVDILFVIALAGWMPSAIDVSVWHSVWTVAKIKATGYKPTLKESLTDFNIGYIGTAVLSLAFLALGAFVLFGSGKSFPDSSVGFSQMFLNLYTSIIGSWTYPIIATAALAAMFSTTLTVLDAYPRVLKEASLLLMDKKKRKRSWPLLSYVWLTVLVLGTMAVLSFFLGQLKLLVDVATSLSFLVAPLLAYLNYSAVMSSSLPSNKRPSTLMQLLSLIGIMFLSAFALYYLALKIGMII